MLSKKNKAIQICDYGYIQGGASQVAVNTSILLKSSKKYEPIFFCSKGPVDKVLTKNSIENYCSHQNDVNDAKVYNILKTYFWNQSNYKYIKNLSLGLDKKSTVFHIHSTVKSITSSVVYFLLKNNYKVALTLHDYFFDCPNGGLFNYNTNQICTLKPLSGRCLTTNCDSRNYPIKLIRYMRLGFEKSILHKYTNKINFISISKTSEEIFKSMHPSVKTFFLPNSINIDERDIKKNNLSNKYLFIGRLSKEKGVLELAEVSKKLNLDITFIGDGDCKRKIIEIYPKAKLIGWVNSQEKINEYINKSRALIFPSSWYETFGLVVLDAMKLGVPAIVSVHSAASEFITNDNNGILFDFYKKNDLEEKITISQDDQYILKLKNNLKEYDFSDYQEKTYLNKLEDIYDKILSH
jgi:glycosyltransferase involved in cell wall biosynthesis